DHHLSEVTQHVAALPGIGAAVSQGDLVEARRASESELLPRLRGGHEGAVHGPRRIARPQVVLGDGRRGGTSLALHGPRQAREQGGSLLLLQEFEHTGSGAVVVEIERGIPSGGPTRHDEALRPQPPHVPVEVGVALEGAPYDRLGQRSPGDRQERQDEEAARGRYGEAERHRLLQRSRTLYGPRRSGEMDHPHWVPHT